MLCPHVGTATPWLCFSGSRSPLSPPGQLPFLLLLPVSSTGTPSCLLGLLLLQSHTSKLLSLPRGSSHEEEGGTPFLCDLNSDKFPIPLGNTLLEILVTRTLYPLGRLPRSCSPACGSLGPLSLLPPTLSYLLLSLPEHADIAISCFFPPRGLEAPVVCSPQSSQLPALFLLQLLLSAPSWGL